MKVNNKYRGLPFWCWNGELDKEELKSQVHILKEMGFGGFFMHSRTGLATEYMGDTWMELIRTATEEAEKIGMSAWLYDEDRWPSGTAGGEVTKKLAYQLKFISMYDTDENVEEGVHIAGELGRFAIKLTACNEMEDYYPIKIGEKAKEGYCIKKFFIEHMKGQEFYNGYTYLDTLNLDATKAFLNATHEKYKQKCGDLFGKTLLGVFTDEPHRGAILNGFGTLNKNHMRMLPYAYDLYARFQKLSGEDLSAKLPCLFYKSADKKVNRVMYYYIETLQELFLENFAIPYHEWCKENKLVATGHVLHEDSLAIQTVFQGSVQRYYEQMDYPGVDILTEGNGAYWVAKQVQSVARQMGQEFVLSELYGCTGWQLNFRRHRDVGAWQTLLGINLRCHHLCWYSMEGESKRDFPASIFYQSGWYQDYPYVEEYFARLGEITSKGKPLCETLVINPVESMWLYPRMGWEKNFFNLQIAEGIRLEEAYIKLFKILTTGQVDFDYGDEEILSRKYRIVQEEDGKVKLTVGEARYSTVLLSGMDTVRSTTLKMLSEFAAAGGVVVFVGDKPFCVDAEKKQIPKELLSKSKSIPLERDAVLNYLSAQRFFEIDSAEIITTVRKEGDKYYLVCLNEDRNNAKNGLTLRLCKPFNIEEIRLESGEEYAIAQSVQTLPIRFDAGECRVFRVFEKGMLLPEKTEEVAKKEIELDGEFKYTLNEKNILPLDLAEYSLDGSAFGERLEILQIDRKIRTKLGLPLRGGEMIQPWYRHKYGIAKVESGKHEIVLRFRFSVECVPAQEVRFVTEQSERWEISINGNKLSKEVCGHWIDPCFDEIVFPRHFIKEGENEVILKAQYEDALNLECVYIIGEFGVRTNEESGKSTICHLPEKLKIDDVTNQGLPFYSGSITYYTGISNERVQVELSDCFGAVSKVKGQDHSEYIAFAPYKSGVFDCKGELMIETVLTRRNTFGPLHYKPIYARSYGPNTFLSQGEDYTDNYCLIKQGLLNAPKIKIF